MGISRFELKAIEDSGSINFSVARYHGLKDIF
jgi:hypothetical protein